MENIKYLIIGAGISGLTFANYTKNNYLILEKESEVGGYCRTIKKGDFIWDYAGHFFHFKTDAVRSRHHKERYSVRNECPRPCFRLHVTMLTGYLH